VTPLLKEYAVSRWYWAHEFSAIVYDPHPEIGGLRGRCSGNGGFPGKRLKAVQRAPKADVANALTVREISWKRLPGKGLAPASLVLDGPNEDMPGREARHIPHGFMTIDLDGPTIVERVHLSDGSLMWEDRC
jgi:hypothetical protein